MSAELLQRPRPPIRYQRAIHAPKGWALEDLEWLAWRFRDWGVPEIGSLEGTDRQGRINKTIMRIHQLIIEQYGMPEQS